MTEKEAIDFFEKAHFLREQMDMDSDINSISNILSQPFINMGLVRHYIDKINDSHPENMVLYNIMFPPQGDRVPLGNASNDSLIQHLMWKQKYLQAKRAGKTFDEFCKEMKKIFSRGMNGGLQNNGQAENGNS